MRHGGPPHDRRDRAGSAPDHDVLDGPALEPERVDEDVEEQAADRQCRGQHVDPESQEHEGGQAERDAEEQGVAGRDPAVGQRAASRAEHSSVEVAVDPAIDGAGARGGQGAAEQGEDHQARRRPAAFGHHHPAQCGDEQQRDDARLGEADIVEHDLPRRPGRLARRISGANRCTRHRQPVGEHGEHDGAGPDGAGQGQVKAPQGSRQVQRDDGGPNRNLEGERRQGQRGGGAHGTIDPVPVQQSEKTHDDQHPDRGGKAAMEELDRGIALEAQAEAAATERPGSAATARTTAHNQGAAEDQQISAGRCGTC